MILDLANNYIDEKGIVTLAENINKHETLKWLNLRRNQLEDEGTTYLCKYLGENTVIAKIDISDNFGNFKYKISISYKFSNFQYKRG